ncbi:MAG: ATP-binding protein [Planctomycetota bacterium]|jgi:DNA repair exonuclease SbcCD ATPase subunit
MSVRLRKIEIDRVGPLRGFSLVPGDITVIEGSNEAGKSSIVVGLHRGLRDTFPRVNMPSFGGTRSKTPGYDGTASAEIVHAGADGAPVAGPPPLLCDNPVLWSLLVIPEGNASHTAVGSTDWFADALPHLTGFDAEPLQRTIRERAGLTRTERDAKEWKEDTERITRDIDRIEAFLAMLETLGAQEEELRAGQRRVEELERAAARERAAVAFDGYERLRARLDLIDDVDRTLPNFARYSPDAVRAWRGLEKDRNGAVAAAAEARAAMETRTAEVSEAHAEAERLRDEHGDADELAGRVASADMLARGRACRPPADGGEDAGRGRHLRTIGWVLVALGVVLLAVGLLAGPTALAALGVLAPLGVALIVVDARRGAPAVARARDAERLLEEARGLGIVADDLADLVSRLDRITRDAAARHALLEQAQEEQTRRGRLLEEQAERVSVQEAKLAEIDADLSALRDRTGLPTIAALEAKADERERLERDRTQAVEHLTRHLDEDPRRWRPMIEERRVDDPGRSPTAGRLEALDAKLTHARQRVSAMANETSLAIQRGLAKIDLDDQNEARRRLEHLGAERDKRRLLRRSSRLALRAIKSAHDDLEAHLDQALRDPRDGVNALFQQITGGDWQGVRRTGDGEFEAYGADGFTAPTDALSRGTVDQLYFAVRAGLAERVLGGPAFFVWDDTFLTADPERRRLLVETAVELARRGWQIIYLTVDPTFTDLFETVARERGVGGFTRHALPANPRHTITHAP